MEMVPRYRFCSSVTSRVSTLPQAMRSAHSNTPRSFRTLNTLVRMKLSTLEGAVSGVCLPIKVRTRSLAGAPASPRGGHLDDFSGGHEDDDVRQLQRLAHVVADEDDGLVQLLLQVLHLILQGLASRGIESGEGLIHQHDGGEAARARKHADALLLAAGELGRILVGRLLHGPAAASPGRSHRTGPCRTSAAWGPRRCSGPRSYLGVYELG